MKTLYLSLAFATVFVTFSCNQNKEKLNEVKQVQKAAKSAAVEGSEFIQGPVVDISEPAAVYFHPDSIKLSKLEQALGDKFFAEAEESMFDISTSRDYLIKQKVKIVETEARELRFKKAGGTEKVINLSNPKYTWGLFLFNGKSDPIQVDMRKPEKQFQAYMK